MYRLGVTGTQKGMTHQQAQSFAHILSREIMRHQSPNLELHHGVCIGVDERANNMARSASIRTVGHPPVDRKKMSSCKVDHMEPAKPFLVRNRDIAGLTDLLIVIPKETHEVLRSGTWTTYRYALQHNTPVEIIYPNGSIETP